FISAISIYLGNGDGTFEYTNIYPIPSYYLFSIAFGDFNNDSNLDIVTAIYDANSVGVFLGYGDGTFTLVTLDSVEADQYSNSVVVGDFNSDNLLDFIVARYRKATISIYLGYGNGSFHVPMLISTDDNYPVYIVTADLNNDTKLDLVF